MNRFTTTFLLATSLLACATDPSTPADDPTGDGKADGTGGSIVERTLATTTEVPDHVMQDATYLYYIQRDPSDSQAHQLMRIAKAGGTPEYTATLPFPFIARAALGGSTLYLYDGNELYSIPSTAGDITHYGPVDQVWAMTADATGAWIAVDAHEGDHYFQRIQRVATTPIEVARATFVTAMQTDDANLYWLDETMPNPAIGCGRFAGAARTASKLGGLDLTLATGINCPIDLALDAANVYFSNWTMVGSGAGTSKISKFGGIALPFGTTPGAGLVAAGSYVYWIADGGKVERTSKLFGVSREIAHGAASPLLADPSAVYFWRRTDGGAELVRVGN